MNAAPARNAIRIEQASLICACSSRRTMGRIHLQRPQGRGQAEGDWKQENKGEQPLIGSTQENESKSTAKRNLSAIPEASVGRLGREASGLSSHAPAGESEISARTNPQARLTDEPRRPFPLHLLLLQILARQLAQRRGEVVHLLPAPPCALKPLGPSPRRGPFPSSSWNGLQLRDLATLVSAPACTDEAHLKRVPLVTEKLLGDGVRE